MCHVPSPSHRARCCNTRLSLCGDPGIRPLLTPLRQAHRTRSFSRAAVPATMSFFRRGAVCRTDRHLCPGPGPTLSSRMGYFGLVVEAEVPVPTPQTLLWLRNERRLVCDLSGGDVQSEEFRDSCIAKPLSFALSERRMCLLFPVVRCSDNPCGLIVRSYQKLPVEGQMIRTLLPRGSTELLSRRGLLRASCGLPGLPIADFLARRQLAASTPQVRLVPGKAKSCIVLFCWGGMSHHDTFDPKPDAPAETRGEFSTIRTATPCLFVSEHLPNTARCTDRLAVVRSVHHFNSSHGKGMYWNMTGHPPPQPTSPVNLLPSRSDWPSLGAMVSQFRKAPRNLQGAVQIPVK